MKLSLAPSLIREIHGVTILWFKNSNKYILLNDLNYSLLSSFIKSKDDSEFHFFINTLDNFPSTLSNKLYSEFEQLLNSLNVVQSDLNTIEFTGFSDTNYISVFYKIKDLVIKVCYQSQFEKDIIHPQFSYLELKDPNLRSNFTFYIKNNNETLHLFKNKIHLGTYNQSDYHLLQGKFAMELLCGLTHTIEDDWLGTFHASTISNSKEAIMLVGESGKGKSTLATLLMANGFNLIADDFTPILAKSQKINPYPSAISMKNGSFRLLDSLSEKIEFKANSLSHIKKGDLKYVSPINTIEEPISCNKIILVAYSPEAETKLDIISAEEILNILIPDSWLSPIAENAAYFLDWLETCHFYKLTYSDSNSVVLKIKSLIDE
ncbi:hypothetical protein [Bizionia arctica]|uniref:Serine kinase n=1 Tax=Bizionia arctica TaxID=1495645 RepID=A0A917GX66_9FLAO|nr:hypothetical protein [Bizionia arctica]GGG60058.1 hypothetical protein GCM10010976_33510 [Bizionia arctica]